MRSSNLSLNKRKGSTENFKIPLKFVAVVFSLILFFFMSLAIVGLTQKQDAPPTSKLSPQNLRKTPTYPNRVVYSDSKQAEQKKLLQSQYEGKLIEFSVNNLEGTPSHGTFVIWTRPSWAPLGVKQFEHLADYYFVGCAFFRVLKNFVVQFGINPTLGKATVIKDDPSIPNVSNVRGTVSFAISGKNTRSSQLFINKGDNSRLDKENFVPIGIVVRGMDVVDRIYSQYGEKPNQGKIWRSGSSYLFSNFPHLSYITQVQILDIDQMTVNLIKKIK